MLLENVPALLAAKFAPYRAEILAELHRMGYVTWWQVIRAEDHSVPQHRDRAVLVALWPPWAQYFRWSAHATRRRPRSGKRSGTG